MSLLSGSKKEYRSEEDLRREQDLANQVSRNLVVHKMPKGYRTNGFSYQDYFADSTKTTLIKASDSGQKIVPAPTLAPSHKKIGLVIVVIGVLVVVGLGYLGWMLMSRPGGFDIASLFGSKESEVNNVIPKINNQVNTPVASSSSSTVATSSELLATSTIPATSTPLVSSKITDTDADGLSDEEERALGTDVTNIDTDGDSYNDLIEVTGSYNPTGKGALSSNPNLKRYTNATKNYSLYYPKTWTVSAADQGNTIILTALDNSFIQIVVQPNTAKVSIDSWALSELNLVADVASYGWGEGLSNNDASIYYLTDNSKSQIFIFSYVPATGQPTYYQNIFDLIIKSFAPTK